MKKFLSIDLLVLFAYALLTILFTYPLAFRIGAALPGVEFDTYVYIWNMEWVRRAIFELGTNPYFTRAIYYPNGISLYYHSLILGSDVLALPLQFAFGPVSAYMLMTLAMFVLSGYGAFLLAYEFVRQRGAAFFAGFAFTFAPYHLAHLTFSHFDLMPLQWLPLFALALKKFFDRPNGARLLSALLFLIWNSITDWYYGLYALVFLGIYSLYRILTARAWRPLLLALTLVLVYVIVMSPVLVPMAQELNDWPTSFRGLHEADAFSADLLNYITPSTYHPLWGSTYAPPPDSYFGGNQEHTLFLGYTTIALVLGAVWSRRKRARRRDLYFWIAAGLIFLVLSLGPFLHVGGITRFGPDRALVYLPYAEFFKLPVLSSIFSAARVISRFGSMVMLSFCIVAAYGLQALTRSRAPRASAALLVSACGLVAFEFLVRPLPTTSTQVPNAVQALAAAPDDRAVLDVPIDNQPGGEAMYFSLIDHKPTMNGYHARSLPSSTIHGIPSMRRLLALPDTDDILIEPDPTPSQVLSFFKVRYITLHKHFASYIQMGYPNAEVLLQNASAWIEKNFMDRETLADDARVTLYELPDHAPPVPLIAALAQGWYEPERLSDGTLWRWMLNDGRVELYVQAPQTVTLSLDAFSPAQPRRLQIFLNGVPTYAATISADRVEPIRIAGLSLRAGTNEWRIHSDDAAAQIAGVADAEPTTRAVTIRCSRVVVQRQDQ